MVQIVENIKNCRICKNSNLTSVISLGEQIITSRFPKYGDFSTPKTAIDLCKCSECGLLQLLQTTFSSELYEYEYGYRSGISNTMRDHLKQYQLEIISKVILNEGDFIIDIGSNDSTMLQYYSDNLIRIGIDPTGNQFKEYYGNVNLIPNYFTLENFRAIYPDENIKCKIISSISMFYDLPDPVQFAKDIYELLDPEGIWTCEQSYMLSMLKTNSIDTICHEHLEYYCLYQIKKIADMAKLKIIDVSFNDCNGGSFRIYLAKRESISHSENIELINKIINDELEYGIMNNEIYNNFLKNCNLEVKKLITFIDTINKNNQNIYLYGASTKGNCLLQFANIKEDKIKYAVDRNMKKVGKMTNTGIEIISEETMRNNPPNYLLVLPWHFKKEIIERENNFLKNGGKLIFPFPKFEIISLKKKLLITGCDGMISHYIKKSLDFLKDYELFGIGNSKSNNFIYENNILKFYFDLNDSKYLEFIINSLNPNTIIHLASFSNAEYCLYNPIDTLHTNGMITANLCDIIYRNKLNTKLFNSSSSEMFKGHVDYEVKENDTHMFHLHPYSIAKIMGHSMVNFYRTTYNLPFYNGIFFTIESPIKKNTFLISKITTHINNWISGNKYVLEVGNLDSYRNILQADKAVDKIYKIINQDRDIINQDIAGDYLICDNKSNKMFDLVYEMYQNAGIKLYVENNIFYESESNKEILIINDNFFGHDTIASNIRGTPSI